MRKVVLTAAAIPTALGIAVALYAFAPTAPPAPRATIDPMAITVSAASADPKREASIGTGGGSGNSVKPQAAPTQTPAPAKATKKVKGSVPHAAARKGTRRGARDNDASNGPLTFAGTERDGASVR